jgi:hypothetical protein
VPNKPRTPKVGWSSLSFEAWIKPLDRVAMTKRSNVRFLVEEDGNGEPIIVVEPLAGEYLRIFKDWRVISFDLREGVTHDEASDVARYLNEKLRAIAET